MSTREYASPDRAARIAARLGGTAVSGVVQATAAAAEWDAAERAERICPACGWSLDHAHLPGACSGCCAHV